MCSDLCRLSSVEIYAAPAERYRNLTVRGGAGEYRDANRRPPHPRLATLTTTVSVSILARETVQKRSRGSIRVSGLLCMG